MCKEIRHKRSCVELLRPLTGFWLMQVRNGRQVEGLCHTYACIRSPATNTPSDLFRMTVRRVFQRRLWSLEFSQINIRCWPFARMQHLNFTTQYELYCSRSKNLSAMKPKFGCSTKIGRIKRAIQTRYALARSTVISCVCLNKPARVNL